MSVLDGILEDAQPGYEGQVAGLLNRLRAAIGEEHFAGVDKAGLILHVVRLLDGAAGPSRLVLQLICDLAALSWWCGLEMTDETSAALAALTRKVHYKDAEGIRLHDRPADAAARHAHVVFIGSVVNPLHSPTRGAFEYLRALAADPRTRTIEVFHQGTLTPELVDYGLERLSGLGVQPDFFCMDDDPDFILKAVQKGPRTFHFWCEGPFLPHISLTAIFGPTLMFICGDDAPAQFADAYWYCHEADYIRDLWRRRGAPASFAANYRQLDSVCFNLAAPARRRDRAELGLRPDDIVLTTAGNRLSVEFDQAFVDGLGGLLLANPKLRWLVVGRLRDYWISAFSQVLGDQFVHVEFDPDLASLFAVTDIFANPFRAGGGNTAIMAIEAGAAAVTRGDMGDVGAFVPAGHRAADAGAYFQELEELIADPALRAARLAEQQALLSRRLDQALFARELGALCEVAYERFVARHPLDLETIYAQPRVSGGRARPPRAH
jgi:hypothetical protein